ncbi:MAG: hypothetical protein NC320_13760, partial [Clostridium sp.]|nr:hypothetical protein [Clostridium sp.]
FFKETEEGVSHMCKLNEDMRNETIIRTKQENALKMLSIDKLTYEEIAECSGLTLEEVQELAKEVNVNA